MINIKLPKKIKNLIPPRNNDDVIKNNRIVAKFFSKIKLDDNDIKKRMFGKIEIQ